MFEIRYIFGGKVFPERLYSQKSIFKRLYSQKKWFFNVFMFTLAFSK